MAMIAPSSHFVARAKRVLLPLASLFIFFALFEGQRAERVAVNFSPPDEAQHLISDLQVRHPALAQTYGRLAFASVGQISSYQKRLSEDTLALSETGRSSLDQATDQTSNQLAASIVHFGAARPAMQTVKDELTAWIAYDGQAIYNAYDGLTTLTAATLARGGLAAAEISREPLDRLAGLPGAVRQNYNQTLNSALATSERSVQHTSVRVATAVKGAGAQAKLAVGQIRQVKIGQNAPTSLAAAGTAPGWLSFYNQYILDSWNKVADFIFHIAGNAALSWANFFGGKTQTVQVTATGDLKEQVKQQVSEQLKQLVSDTTGPAVLNQVTGTSNQNTGIVIFPQSDSPALDELEKQQIEKTFSDKVVIYLDKGGKSGVVQPVFKNSFGKRFIFLLAPISNQQ